jgi:hypothetical protein
LSEQTILSNQKDGKGGSKKALIIAISDYEKLPEANQLPFVEMTEKLYVKL